MSAFPYLTALVLVPAGGALVVAAVPARSAMLARVLGLVAGIATFGLAVAAAVVFKVGDGGYQLVSSHAYVRAFGVGWVLGLDGISLFLVLLTTLLFPLALLGAPERRDTRSYVAWMLVLESACLGSFLSLDLLLFFLFFEVTLVPAYFVIGGWGYERRGPAALKFFLYTFLGSAFLLVGIVSVAFIHERQTGQLTFNLLALSAHGGFRGGVGILLFLAFTAAFAVKAPVFPFHTWSPEAYSQSPTGGVMVIAGVMAKLGSYGIIRFDFDLFPQATVRLAPLLLTLAVASILYGAVVACRQRDLKRMVAYSSLSHLGFIVLGFFALTQQGLDGAVLEMTNHGLYTAALFLLIGMVYVRRKTFQAGELNGLQRSMPILAGVFTVAMLAAIGLPGLNGFVGEFLILIGTFATHRWWAVAATIGVVFAAIYLLWAYQRAFHGQPSEENAKAKDLSWREGAVLAPLVILIVAIGIYPRPLLDRITPSVVAIVHHVEASTSYVAPSVTTTGRVAALGGKG